MNVHPGRYISAEQEPSVLTAFLVMHVNVPRVMKETGVSVVNRLKSKLAVAPTLIVLTTPNVQVMGRADVGQDLTQLERFVLTSMSVNVKRIFVGPVLPALIKLEVSLALVNHR